MRRAMQGEERTRQGWTIEEETEFLSEMKMYMRNIVVRVQADVGFFASLDLLRFFVVDEDSSSEEDEASRSLSAFLPDATFLLVDAAVRFFTVRKPVADFARVFVAVVYKVKRIDARVRSITGRRTFLALAGAFWGSGFSLAAAQATRVLT